MTSLLVEIWDGMERRGMNPFTWGGPETLAGRHRVVSTRTNAMATFDWWTGTQINILHSQRASRGACSITSCQPPGFLCIMGDPCSLSNFEDVVISHIHFGRLVVSFDKQRLECRVRLRCKVVTPGAEKVIFDTKGLDITKVVITDGKVLQNTWGSF